MTTRGMDALIRQAARGRAPAPAPELERPAGDFRVGEGGSARPQPMRTTSAEISDAIRVAAHAAQNRVGLGVDLDDVLGG